MGKLYSRMQNNSLVYQLVTKSFMKLTTLFRGT